MCRLAHTTLFFAIFIWFNEKKQDWENSLPKRLNVTYLLHDKEYAVVENAPLASEADIRHWSLSIAQTILNKQTRIDFGGFRIRDKKIDARKKVMLYLSIVYLNTTIEGIPEGSSFSFGEDGRIVNNRNRQESTI